LIARGFERREAERRARAEFGAVEARKDECREALGLRLLDEVRQDAIYGLRQFRQRPTFHAVAILTMALAIGTTTLLFSVAYGVLLKPLGWPDADRLIRLTETRQGRTGRVPGTITNGTFLAWRDHPTTLEDLGGWLTQTATLSGVGDPIRISVI